MDNDTRWWHGGPQFTSDFIEPPATTGAEMLTSFVPFAFDDLIDAPDSVYLINDRFMAVVFASVHPNPWLYLCEPLGQTEPDPDYKPQDDGVRAVRCPRARIIRREKPSGYEIRAALHLLQLADAEGT